MTMTRVWSQLSIAISISLTLIGSTTAGSAQIEKDDWSLLRADQERQWRAPPRFNVEKRRRTKIIPHAVGERPVLKLMFAAIIRTADRWRGIQVGEFEQRQLGALRDELGRAHTQRVAPTAAQAMASRIRKVRP